MNHDSRSLEDDLSSLKADVAVMRSRCVTKADLQILQIEVNAEILSAKFDLMDGAQVERTSLNDGLGDLRLEVQRDFERLRAEIHSVRSEFYKALDSQTWKIIVSTTVLVSAIYFIVHTGY